jgi:hypothetical protein
VRAEPEKFDHRKGKGMDRERLLGVFVSTDGGHQLCISVRHGFECPRCSSLDQIAIEIRGAHPGSIGSGISNLSVRCVEFGHEGRDGWCVVVFAWVSL